jgi:ParB family chromosome partitioning protein
LAVLQEIPLEQLEPNVFATRFAQCNNIEELAKSISAQGQLEPIAVRPHPGKTGYYQIIYGHRRVQAAKMLGLRTIKAEIMNVDDISMLQIALVENLQRKDLSDFEKGLIFRNLSERFNLSYEEIGRSVGKSKQLISNHIAMTRMFSERELDTDHELFESLLEITEAQARVLCKVTDSNERIALTKFAARERVSARELSALVERINKRFNLVEESDLPWLSDNIRNNSDNRNRLKLKHGRVCVIRAEALNLILSQLKISPYEAGRLIAAGAAQVLLEKGVDPHLAKNWSKILIEKSKYAGWGKMSTTTDSRLVIHDSPLNPEFLRGYLEALLGVRLICLINNSRVQEFEIVSYSDKYASSYAFSGHRGNAIALKTRMPAQ